MDFTEIDVGLSIQVGVLADLIEIDEEGAQWLRDDFKAANAVLRQHELPEHSEPEEFPSSLSRSSVCGFPYSYLHYLRRAAAHDLERRSRQAASAADPLHAPRGFAKLLALFRASTPPVFLEPLPLLVTPLVADDPTKDSLYRKWCDRGVHLIDHSDCEGFYLPIDFQDVLVSESVSGFAIGSSYRLHSELLEMAPAIGVVTSNGDVSDEEAARLNDLGETDEGLYREVTAWLSLFEAARLSILYRTAVVFG